jgi:hypothetical protein
MGDEQDHKLEIIMHYNDKSGVDVLDKPVGKYSYTRSTRH